jgi:predicted nucleotidyltransferase
LNFESVLGVVSGFLEEKGVSFAVIGGVAIVAYGLPRTTLDLDLIVESSVQDDLIRFLESRGYKTLHRSSGFSNHQHPNPLMGNLDFVYVGPETSREIFAACRIVKGPGGRPIRVPKPEHMAALKANAMKNDPTRTFQDMADVRFLLTLPGVDRGQIRDYFDRQGMGDRFDELEKA